MRYVGAAEMVRERRAQMVRAGLYRLDAWHEDEGCDASLVERSGGLKGPYSRPDDVKLGVR